MGSRISYNDGARKMIPPKRKKNITTKSVKKIFHLVKQNAEIAHHLDIELVPEKGPRLFFQEQALHKAPR